jgi:predicted hydrocarbon binding protein
MFVEPTGDSRTADAIKKVIDESPFVLSSSVTGSEDGVLVSKELFPIRMGTGHRVMVIRTGLMSKVLKSTRESFGSGGDLIVYNEGYAAGKSDAETFVKLIGKSKYIEHATLLVQLRTALGWGRATFVEFQVSPFKARAKVEDSFECADQKSSKPFSQFLRGHFAGLASGVMGADVHCKETKCVAMGDPYCEFELEQKQP